ncbi:MAG: hypothetical protein HC772_02310 [Leptolyngbyaceae cyanobacterium CRU_2_3]|nr:hypothetical protein [Leptolyngbyaceae cyanobacterium CRU_2_3]
MGIEPSNLTYVPTTPKDYVSRSQEQEIISKLVAQSQNPTQSFVVLHGSSGYGKSTLAVAICHNPNIKKIFAENIYWVKIGDGEDSSTLYKQLKQFSFPLHTEISCIDLKLELRNRRCLVVLDNLRKWDELKDFLEAGASSYCTWLITTQTQEAVPLSSIKDNGYQFDDFHISRMTRNEAFRLLRYGLSEFDQNKLQKLADGLYEFPLLIKLARKKINEKLDTFKRTIDQALDLVNQDLSEVGISVLDEELSHADEKCNPQVSGKLSICYELLGGKDKELFTELSIFPSHVRIPLLVVGRLWNQKQGDARRLCEKLYKLSLLERFDLGKNIIVLNDFLRKYCLEKESKERIYSAHEKLIRAYENLEEKDLSEQEEIYLQQYLRYHLKKAGRKIVNCSSTQDSNYLVDSSATQEPENSVPSTIVNHHYYLPNAQKATIFEKVNTYNENKPND